jgi:hypothetical protein
MHPRDLFGVAIRTMGVWLLANAIVSCVQAPLASLGIAPAALMGAILISRADRIVNKIYGKPPARDSI